MLLLSDAIYGVRLLEGGYDTAGILDVGWAIYYTLLGTSALHPSMRQLSEPGPEPDGRLTRARLALLTCASLTAPLVIVVRVALDELVDLYVLVGASALMFALVLLRMAGIVRRNEQATRREAALRIAGEALVSAATREDVYVAALQAARSVVEEPVTACLYIAEEPGGRLVAVGASDDRDPASLPTLRREELPEQMLRRLPGNRVLTLDGPGEAMSLSPLFVRDQLTGTLAVLSAGPLRNAAQESLATLATEVALALQTVALTEESVSQRSEERLSALITNASDVICIVAADAVVQLREPVGGADVRIPAEALEGRELDELVHPDEVQRLLSLFAVDRRAARGRALDGRVPRAPRARGTGATWRCSARTCSPTRRSRASC